MTTYSDNDVRAWLSEMATAGYLNLDVNSRLMAARALQMLDAVQPAPPPGPAPEPLPPGYLTPHFTEVELIYSTTAEAHGIDNRPNENELEELTKTAELLEEIRSILGDVPVMVSSGFRNAEVNRLVGGAANSAHRWGGAADISAPSFGDPLAICRAIEPHMVELGIDQLIYESGGGAYWVHVGRPEPGNGARAQAFSIAGGATSYTPFPNA